MDKKRVLSMREFCKRYDISFPTFYREVALGRLVVRKIGKKNIITLDAEQEWLKSLPLLETEAA